MSAGTSQIAHLATEWQQARYLHSLFTEVGRRFQIQLPACPELESPIDSSGEGRITAGLEWVRAAEKRIDVAQLRQVLQSTLFGADEDLLRWLAVFYLKAPNHDDLLRAKLDFILVQYFAHHAPAESSQVTYACVAAALKPALGSVPPLDAANLAKSDAIISELQACRGLKDMLDRKLIEKARIWKEALAGIHFEAGLVEITRLNFHLRIGFVRLLYADVYAIRALLQQMEAQGITAVDCSAAGLTKTESLPALRSLCQRWMSPFRQAYEKGHSFIVLVHVRSAAEQVLKAREKSKA
jgi:hypothetical protein